MKTKMYTIGVGVKTQFGMTVLDPGRKVETSKYVDNGFTDKTVTEELIKQLGTTKYDYADKSYIGEMSTTQLQTAMSQIFTSSIPKTQTWTITQADINNAKTYLPDINISTIKITQDGTNKNYDTSKIIFYDETAKKNYIDLSKLDPSNTITITYTAK